MALVTEEMEALESQIIGLKQKLTELRRAQPPETVGDFTFDGLDGSVKLSELFDGKQDLLVIHNMGKGCPYCTLWADGFTGLYPELSSRASFVLVSPNPIAVGSAFAAERGWNFPVASDPDHAFATAMGFYSEEGGSQPGVSAFQKDDDGTISRVSYTWFGPGDDFCPVWPFLDLLKDGPNDWEPAYRLTPQPKA